MYMFMLPEQRTMASQSAWIPVRISFVQLPIEDSAGNRTGAVGSWMQNPHGEKKRNRGQQDNLIYIYILKVIGAIHRANNPIDVYVPSMPST